MVERFGRYRVTGKLGAGAMGEVYAAVDDVLGRQVAIKTLRSQASGVGARMVDERFRLEARAIATLTHPGIVQVFDIDLSANPPFLVMERVIGPSLKERLEQGPAMPESDVRGMGIQIAHALAAAHAAGIVHRDVKPANILFAGDGKWRLVDFGVAHVPDSSLTMTGQFIGSPAYAAPEALVGGKSLPAGDIFGLGATLYLAASGKWPRGDGPSAPLAPIPSVRELAPGLDAALVEAIDRAIALEHERRPTALELAAALERPPAKPAADETVFVPDEPRKPRRRWKPLVLGAAGVLLLGAAIAIGTATRSARAPASRTSGAPLATADAATVDDAIVDDSLELDAADADASIDAGSANDDPPPGQFRIRTPPLPTDPQAAKDWRALVDNIYERNLDEARDQLDAWQMKWGIYDETRAVRRQIDAARNLRAP